MFIRDVAVFLFLILTGKGHILHCILMPEILISENVMALPCAVYFFLAIEHVPAVNEVCHLSVFLGTVP